MAIGELVNDKQASVSGEYWKQHTVSWEASAYFEDTNKKPAFWDKVSTWFRGRGMYVRMDAALKLVAPHVKDKVLLDIGCASGRFPFLLMKAGAKRVIGVDVVPAVIDLANQRRLASPYADRMEFSVLDLGQPGAQFPEVDIVTALGVIEYFNAAELDSILSRMKAKHFLFEFPDSQGRQEDRVTWQLRRVYLWLNHCPGVYLYSQDEFNAMAASYGYENVWYTRYATFYFATNLPHA
jgi:cyclopropane fatty-acyl-phospholipid synthase-like methyltransferase